MKLIKKFIAIQVYSEKVNEDVNAKFSFGTITGPYYDLREPTIEYDSEEEAIQGAFKEDEYCTWIIVPSIRFEHEYK